MAALRRLLGVISDSRSKKKAGPSKVTGLFFLVAGAGLPSRLRRSFISASECLRGCAACRSPPLRATCRALERAPTNKKADPVWGRLLVW